MPNPLSPDAARPRRRLLSRRQRRLIVTGGFSAAAALALVAGLATASAATHTPAPLVRAPYGQLDTPVAGVTGLRVTGWAVDPDATSPVLVDLSIDGKRQPVVTANIARSDLGGARHGFSLGLDAGSGAHTVCASVRNVGSGPTSVSLGCRRGSVTVSPFGAITGTALAQGGVLVTGWAADTDTAGPLSVSVSVDGKPGATGTANLARSDVARAHPNLGANHGFSVAVHNLTQGVHRVCMTATNVGAGTTPASINCVSAPLNFSPTGGIDAIGRPAGSKSITITGWATDPDSSAPISLGWSLDGKPHTAQPANVARGGYASPFSWVTGNHGFSFTTVVDNAAHTVCITARNVGAGGDTSLGCKTSPAMTARPPSAPHSIAVVGGTGRIHVVWTPPSSNGGAPVTVYGIKASTLDHTVPVPYGRTSFDLLNMPAGRTVVTVNAVNAVGGGPGSSAAATVAPSPYTPQRTPALISTSRYIRNINGNNATDRAKTYAMGVADAAHNPSGHRYLILLQIGGQNTSGVVLSATSQFVSYRNTVIALQAYLDGYHTRQGRTAPVTIAIGTNNDMDVRATTGTFWATQVVNPLYSYAKRYANMTIAGANDIEPGFIGSPSASMAWVKAFLAATPATFVFNGSADGCNWTVANGNCNNGWNARVMQYVSGGASPSRVLSLPQIYNTTMAQQWKFISLTGVSARLPRLNFAGPLTEWTACYAQGYGCGSLSNNAAWSALWAAISSDARVAQNGLPYGTDLRVN